MKPIKITSFSTVARTVDGACPAPLAVTIEGALHVVNGTATTHTYNHGYQVLDALSAAEAEIVKLLGAKKYLPGSVVVLQSGERVESAYKYTRIGTEVRCERRRAAWYITAIASCTLYKEGGGRRSISFTPDQDVRARAVLRSQYTIVAKAEGVQS